VFFLKERELLVFVFCFNALRWNAYAFGRLPLNGSNEKVMWGGEFPDDRGN